MATFVDQDPAATASDFKALLNGVQGNVTVNWGDGTTSTLLANQLSISIAPDTGVGTPTYSLVTITGSHTYNTYPVAGPFTFTITVTVQDNGNASSTLTNSFTTTAANGSPPLQNNTISIPKLTNVFYAPNNNPNTNPVPTPPINQFQEVQNMASGVQVLAIFTAPAPETIPNPDGPNSGSPATTFYPFTVTPTVGGSVKRRDVQYGVPGRR